MKIKLFAGIFLAVLLFTCSAENNTRELENANKEQDEETEMKVTGRNQLKPTDPLKGNKVQKKKADEFEENDEETEINTQKTDAKLSNKKTDKSSKTRTSVASRKGLGRVLEKEEEEEYHDEEQNEEDENENWMSRLSPSERRRLYALFREGETTEAGAETMAPQNATAGPMEDTATTMSSMMMDSTMAASSSDVVRSMNCLILSTAGVATLLMAYRPTNTPSG